MSREPEYVAISRSGMNRLGEVSMQENSLLLCLIQHCENSKEFGGVIVVLHPRLKRQIRDTIGWKNVGTIDINLLKLRKKGIIEWVDRGTYKFNPEIFLFKGGCKR